MFFEGGILNEACDKMCVRSFFNFDFEQMWICISNQSMTFSKSLLNKFVGASSIERNQVFIKIYERKSLRRQESSGMFVIYRSLYSGELYE
jgi:hypothetical protein